MGAVFRLGLGAFCVGLVILRKDFVQWGTESVEWSLAAY